MAVAFVGFEFPDANPLLLAPIAAVAATGRLCLAKLAHWLVRERLLSLVPGGNFGIEPSSSRPSERGEQPQPIIRKLVPSGAHYSNAAGRINRVTSCPKDIGSAGTYKPISAYVTDDPEALLAFDYVIKLA